MRQGVEAPEMLTQEQNQDKFNLDWYTKRRNETKERMQWQMLSIALEECELADKRLDWPNVLWAIDAWDIDTPEDLQIIMKAAVKMGTLKPEDARMLASYYRTYNDTKFA